MLFPRGFSHRWVAELFAPMTVVAAGFVTEAEDGIACGGASAGLGVASRTSRDTALVRAALGGEG